MLLGTVLGFDALTFNFVLLRAQCLRAMGRIKRGAVGMPKRNKIKREPVEAVETVPSPPQEAVEEAAAEPEVQVQQQRRREVPWALAKRWTSKMKKDEKVARKEFNDLSKAGGRLGAAAGGFCQIR